MSAALDRAARALRRASRDADPAWTRTDEKRLRQLRGMRYMTVRERQDLENLERRLDNLYGNRTGDAVKKGDMVWLRTPRPLPGGKTVKLRGRVDFIRPDGRVEVRVATPGLYGGGIQVVPESEIEA